MQSLSTPRRVYLARLLDAKAIKVPRPQNMASLTHAYQLYRNCELYRSTEARRACGVYTPRATPTYWNDAFA